MKRNRIENKENLEANSSPLKKCKSTFKDFSGSPRTPNNLLLLYGNAATQVQTLPKAA